MRLNTVPNIRFSALLTSLLVLASCSSSTTNTPVEVGEPETLVEAAQEGDGDILSTESRSFALGDSFGCVLEDGVARCWGAHVWRQGTDDDGWEPVPDLTDAVAIDAGHGFFCVRTRAGLVRCWGDNDEGQLGLEGEEQGQPVPGIQDAVLFDVGEYRSCAANVTGAIRCWGATFQRAREIGQLSGIKSLSVGSEGVCGVARGRAYCWSRGERREIPSIEDAVEVAGADDSAIVRTSTGAVWAWSLSGYDPGFAALWLGDEAGSGPHLVPGLEHGALSLSFDLATLCARVEDGVRCLGFNWDGAVGDGTTIRRAAAVPVVDLGPVRNVQTASSWTCALGLDGEPRCWGRLDMDRSGVEIDSGSAPARVPGISGATAISVSGNLSCARDDEGWWCWGEHTQSSPGHVASATPTRLPIPGAANFASIHVAGVVSPLCAIDGDSALRCYDVQDHLGSEAQLLGRVPGIAQLVMLNGFNHCARHRDGRVRCWDSNGARMLGDEPAIELPFPNARHLDGDDDFVCAALITEVRCLALTSDYEVEDQQTVAVANAQQVAVEGYAACALDSDGRVWCWELFGDNQLRAMNLPARALQLEAGSAHTCAALQDGTVACWGANIDGRLGQPTSIEESAAPLVVPQLTDVVEIDLGTGHACARHRDGGVSCWGQADDGQLGRPWEAITLRPIVVPRAGAREVGDGL